MAVAAVSGTHALAGLLRNLSLWKSSSVSGVCDWSSLSAVGFGSHTSSFFPTPSCSVLPLNWVRQRTIPPLSCINLRLIKLWRWNYYKPYQPLHKDPVFKSLWSPPPQVMKCWESFGTDFLNRGCGGFQMATTETLETVQKFDSDKTVLS